ncbi:MAG: extracellular solute-binding protein, partial [[Clostridium] cellulosi]
MKKIRKLAALVLMASLIAGMTSGCSKNQASSKKAREIYFLNFKPEIADKYKAIASEYEKKTGVHVKVVTAASGTYEQTLKAEVAKSDPPTIFQINGLVGYKNWKDY